MRKSLILMLLAVTLIYASMIAKASANPAPTEIWATDAGGVTKTTFDLNEIIHVKAHSETTPYNVSIYDPDYILVHMWPAYEKDFDSGPLTDATNKAGKWSMRANSSIAGPVAWMVVGTYFVIPDAAAFGVLGIVTACFAAFGIKAVRVQRKP